RIVLEVKTDTEIMQVSAQLELVFVTGEAVLLADVQVFLDRYVIAPVTFQRLAHSFPGGRKSDPDVRQSLELLLNECNHVVEAAIRGQIRWDRAAQVCEPRPQ